jgi:PAS domain S-box-containing protein
MLLNSQGGWLVAPDPQDAWSHLLGRDSTLAQRQPQAWAHIVAAPSGRMLDKSGLWVWDSIDPATLLPGGVHASDSWKLVSHLQRKQLRQLWWQDWPLLLLSGGVTLLLLAFGVRRYSELLSAHDAAAADLAAARQLQQSQAELQKSHDLLSLTEQSAGIGFWDWDMELGPDCLNWSNQMFRLFGLDLASASASFDTWRQMVHPDDLPAAETSITDAIRECQPFAATYRIVWPDGTIHWVEAFGRASYDEAGAPKHFSGLCLDVTARMRSAQTLRESEKRFRDLFEYLPIAYQSLDAQGRWLDANQEMVALLGYESPAQMIGLSFAAHWTNTSCAFDDCFAEIKKERNFSGELQLMHRDGHLVTAIAHCRTQHDSNDNFLRTHAVLINISERLAMEQTLRDLNANLERKVSERTAEIQLLAENASDVVFRGNNSGVFEWISPSVTALVGWLPEQMIGQPFVEFIHPDDLATVGAAQQRLLQGERTTFETRIRTRDGGWRWVSIVAKAILNAADQVEARVGGWRDIQSEVVARNQLSQSRQQLEHALADMTASEARFHAIFAQSPIGIGLIDSRSGHIYECNERYACIAGRSIEEMRRVDWMSITHPDDIQPDLDNMTRLNAGEVLGFQMNKRYLRPDGSVVWVRMTVARVQVDPHEGLRHLCMMEDITEQIQIEQSLLAAKDAAEQASRAKSAFVANMSHEVRTPMNAVLGFLDILADSGLDAQQRILVDKVQKSSRALLRILNDILDFSKLDAGAVDLEMAPFAIEDVLRDAADLFALTASAKGLELAIDLPPGLPLRYRGDALRLGQILVNLLGNAIKFTEHGSVHLAVRALDQAHGQTSLRFEVADTGIGLTPEQTQRLFQPFVQADSSTTRRFGGTGLGLTIAKRLVELMGGEIGVDSELGHGATFWFTVLLIPDRCVESAVPPQLRQEQVPPDAVLAKPITASRPFDTLFELPPSGFVRLPAVEGNVLDPCQQARPVRGAELLLVEDNFTNQEVALAMLGKMGLQVTVANNGREALQKLAERPYALVLMDLQMPVMDGFEATAAIRATRWGHSLPIIAMTASAFADDRRRVLDAGMNDFVSKPVDPQQLLRTLSRWLPQHPPAAETAADAGPAKVASAALSQPTMAQQQAMLPAQLDGFELAQTLDRLGHDPELVLRVLRQFLSDFEPDDWAGQFDAALLGGQRAIAQRLVHTLLGVAANVGAVRLQAAAAELLAVLKDQAGQAEGDPARLQQCRDDCQHALRAANAVLQAALPATRGQAQPAQPESALQDLAEVEQLLRRHRLVPALLLASLHQHLGPHAAANELGTLRAQIDVFDFESALKTVKAMQDSLLS